MYRLSIAALLLLANACLLSGQSAVDQPLNTEQRLDQNFYQESVDEAQRATFRSRAESLIYEFVDYSNLLNQQDLDAEMQSIILTSVKAMFVDQQTSIRLPQQVKLSSLTAADFSGTAPLEISHLDLKEELSLSKSTTWSYEVIVKKGKTTHTVEVKAKLIRQPKQFGTTQRMVWDVLLLSWEVDH